MRQLLKIVLQFSNKAFIHTWAFEKLSSCFYSRRLQSSTIKAYIWERPSCSNHSYVFEIMKLMVLNTVSNFEQLSEAFAERIKCGKPETAKKWTANPWFGIQSGSRSPTRPAVGPILWTVTLVMFLFLCASCPHDSGYLHFRCKTVSCDIWFFSSAGASTPRQPDSEPFCDVPFSRRYYPTWSSGKNHATHYSQILVSL